jgi:succinate-acetate transporter protein
MWFWTLGAITVAGALAALAECPGLFGVLGFLAAGSFVFAIALSAGSTGTVKVAGWLFVIAAILAWYTATAMMLLAGAGRVILPLAKPKRDANIPGSKPVKPIQLEWGEPGVKKGQ